MAENKMQPSDDSVEDYLAGVEPKRKREDSLVLLQMLREVTGLEPVLWGSIIGFGTYHYRYESGREGVTPVIAFAPRKAALTVYLSDGFQDEYDDLLSHLGKHKTSKVCLYINKLADVNLEVLRELMTQSYEQFSSGERAIYSEKRSQKSAAE